VACQTICTFFYVFLRFFQNPKKHDFLRFFELLHTFSPTVSFTISKAAADLHHLMVRQLGTLKIHVYDLKQTDLKHCTVVHHENEKNTYQETPNQNDCNVSLVFCPVRTMRM